MAGTETWPVDPFVQPAPSRRISAPLDVTRSQSLKMNLTLPRLSPVTDHAHGSQRYGFVLLALCCGQVLLWGCAFGFTYQAPEIDSAEQFVWAFSMENGYWKHPPMPSWIMHGLLRVFGPSVALPFVAAQVCVVVALALVWRLGCEFMSPRRSLIATVLTSLVAYHNVGADSFNHSTALLPFQAATVLLFFMASRRGAMSLWALAGLFAGLSMLVKYVALFPIAGLLLYFMVDRRLHDRRGLAGLAVALAVCIVVLVPHLLWLESTDFLPFRYARSVAKSLPGTWVQLQSLGDFTLVQAIRALPLALGLGYVLVGRAVPPPPEGVAPRPQPRDLMFLGMAAVCPLMFTMLFAVLSQTELQSRWGTNAFLYSGLAAMAWVGRADTSLMLRRTIGTAVVSHVLLSSGMALAKTVLADQIHFKTRANFPGALLAAEAAKVWKEHSDAPLRIVVSDIWLGGNIVAHNRHRVAVLIDGHIFKSPWVDENAITQCGALVLDDLAEGGIATRADSPALDRLMARATVTGIWNLPWAMSQRQATDSATGVVRWGIIQPGNPAACALR